MPVSLAQAQTFLREAKKQLDAESYDAFLDVMKGYSSRTISVAVVMRRVAELFSESPTLVDGFNQFLPAGHRIREDLTIEIDQACAIPEPAASKL